MSSSASRRACGCRDRPGEGRNSSHPDASRREKGRDCRTRRAARRVSGKIRFQIRLLRDEISLRPDHCIPACPAEPAVSASSPRPRHLQDYYAVKSHPPRLPSFRAVGHVGFHVGTHRRGIANGILWTLQPAHTFLWGYLIWGHPRLREGGTSTFDPEGHQRLAALGGSRSCATADGTPVDTGAKNCDPPISTIDGARRGGIVVEAWGRRLFTISFCVRRNRFLRVSW